MSKWLPVPLLGIVHVLVAAMRCLATKSSVFALPRRAAAPQNGLLCRNDSRPPPLLSLSQLAENVTASR